MRNCKCIKYQTHTHTRLPLTHVLSVRNVHQKSVFRVLNAPDLGKKISRILFLPKKKKNGDFTDSDPQTTSVIIRLKK